MVNIFKTRAEIEANIEAAKKQQQPQQLNNNEIIIDPATGLPFAGKVTIKPPEEVISSLPCPPTPSLPTLESIQSTPKQHVPQPLPAPAQQVNPLDQGMEGWVWCPNRMSMDALGKCPRCDVTFHIVPERVYGPDNRCRCPKCNQVIILKLYQPGFFTRMIDGILNWDLPAKWRCTRCGTIGDRCFCRFCQDSTGVPCD